MNAYWNLTLALLLLLFAACDDGDISGRDDNTRRNAIMQESYEPGSEWVFEKSSFEEDGQAWEPDTMKMRIARDTTYDGDRHIFYQLEGKNLGSDDEIEIILKTDGYYAWSDDGEEDGFRRFMKFPIIKGESYEVTPGHIFTVTEFDKKITVPAGVFECIVYKYTNTSNDNYGFLYVSEKYGTIMDEDHWKDDNGNYYLAHKQVLLSVNF